MGKTNNNNNNNNNNNTPRDDFKSFEISEARQYPRLVTNEDIKRIASLLESQDYIIDYFTDEGPIKFLCAHGHESFSIIPIVLLKSEDFTSTSLITIATWGKIRGRAAGAGPLTLGTSVLGAVPNHLKQKSAAKDFLFYYWSFLDNQLGNGHTVAAPLTPSEANDSIWADPSFSSDPSLSEMHFMQPVVNVDKNHPKEGGKFKKFGKWRKGTKAADISVSAANTASDVSTMVDAAQALEAGASATTVGFDVVGAACDAGSVGMYMAGDVLPFVGIGFGYAQYKHARNDAEKGSAMGRMVGSSTMIPLAGLVGSRIGKSIGKKSDGKPTCFEQTELTIWQKKRAALIEIGVLPTENASHEGSPPQFGAICSYFPQAEDRRGLDNDPRVTIQDSPNANYHLEFEEKHENSRAMDGPPSFNQNNQNWNNGPSNQSWNNGPNNQLWNGPPPNQQNWNGPQQNWNGPPNQQNWNGPPNQQNWNVPNNQHQNWNNVPNNNQQQHWNNGPNQQWNGPNQHQNWGNQGPQNWQGNNQNWNGPPSGPNQSNNWNINHSNWQSHQGWNGGPGPNQQQDHGPNQQHYGSNPPSHDPTHNQGQSNNWNNGPNGQQSWNNNGPNHGPNHGPNQWNGPPNHGPNQRWNGPNGPNGPSVPNGPQNWNNNNNGPNQNWSAPAKKEKKPMLGRLREKVQDIIATPSQKSSNNQGGWNNNNNQGGWNNNQGGWNNNNNQGGWNNNQGGWNNNNNQGGWNNNNNQGGWNNNQNNNAPWNNNNNSNNGQWNPNTNQNNAPWNNTHNSGNTPPPNNNNGNEWNNNQSSGNNNHGAMANNPNNNPNPSSNNTSVSLSKTPSTQADKGINIVNVPAASASPAP